MDSALPTEHWALVAAALAWLIDAARHATRLLHALQQEEYQTGRYLRWLAEDLPRALRRERLAGGLLALALALAAGALGLPEPIALGVGLAVAAIGLALALAGRRAPAKKPLRYTPRALATLGVAAVAVAALLALGAWLVRPAPLGLAVGAILASLLVGPLLALANLAFAPVQALGRERILRAARAKVRAHPAVVVGITGSYGKTSVKEILATLLAARAPTLKTPESFNTPLGIARAIIRDLRPEHRFFVVEMGAYGPGEIRRLCQLVGPRVGILTAVNPQHLERFGSLENTARAKYELIEALPPDGRAIFNVDNDWCRRLAARTTVPTTRYGLAPADEIDLTADEIATTADGIAFTLRARGHEPVRVVARLLGRHNVGNILAAAAAAMACGMTPAEIAAAAARLEPVPHRLQLVQGQGGVTVIDDAYNANPDGVAAALEVLREFPGRRKVLVTPGMVELGPREEEENRRFGRLAAAICDAVILVGRRRTAPIRAGLADAGYAPDKTIVVRDVAEATTRLGELLGPGDVVLFANDLPDIYDEAP